MEPWNLQSVAWLWRTVLGRVLFWAAGVVSWEFAFFLLLRAELLSAMLHPVTTNGCLFHRGPGMLSLLEEGPSLPYQAGKLCSEVSGAHGRTLLGLWQ